MMADSLRRGIIKRTNLSYNSLVFSVKKVTVQWCFTVDYWCLNANTDPLTAAISIRVNITATLQEAAHSWMAT